jgi:hypothetical protein
MLLPTKGLSPDRSLLFIGAQILNCLTKATTVSSLWTAVQQERRASAGFAPLTYDWFVLSLDLLFSLGTIRMDEYQRVVRREPA